MHNKVQPGHFCFSSGGRGGGLTTFAVCCGRRHVTATFHRQMRHGLSSSKAQLATLPCGLCQAHAADLIILLCQVQHAWAADLFHNGVSTAACTGCRSVSNCCSCHLQKHKNECHHKLAKCAPGLQTPAHSQGVPITSLPCIFSKSAYSGYL